ncbi:MAG: hypothetical protein IKA74_04925 [Clostridia bacterium]|nr:hypothetical protein [Clostridia bacterium]
MKKFARVLFLVLMIAMLSVCLIACETDDAEGDGTTTTTTADGGTTTTTSSSVSINSKIKQTVRIIDGMTGNVLETRKVSQGSSVNPLNDYRDLHYGYKMNEEKYNADKAQKVLKDTDIIIEYVPKTEYTILLQTGKGATYTAFEYEFKQRLTPEEITAGKDTYIFSNNPTNAKKHNDFTTVTLDGIVKVYEGDSILNIPKAEVTVDGEFEKWLVVTGAENGVGGATGNDIFTGSAVAQNFVIRPYYYKDGTTVFVTDFDGANPLLGLNIAERWDETKSDYTKYNDEVKGNEFVTYGSDPTRIDVDNGAFRLAHRLGDFIYNQGNGTHTPATFNKFTGTDKLGQWDVQADEHTFATWDGEKLYLAIIIRDDTPNQISDADIALCEQWNLDGTAYNFYPAGDNIEFRFMFGTKDEVARPTHTQESFIYTDSTTDENCLRCISTDRLGRVENRSNEPESDKQHLFVKQVDLDGDATNKIRTKQLMQGDKNVGYVVGFEVDIAGYIDYKFVGTEDGQYETADKYWAANNNLFKFIMSVQINDRFNPLMTKATADADSVVTERYWNDDGTKCELLGDGVAGMVGCGGQAKVVNYSTITIANYAEPDEE